MSPQEAVHVSLVQELYEPAYQNCRSAYNRLPSPRKIQTLVQVWKQLHSDYAYEMLHPLTNEGSSDQMFPGGNTTIASEKPNPRLAKLLRGFLLLSSINWDIPLSPTRTPRSEREKRRKKGLRTLPRGSKAHFALCSFS